MITQKDVARRAGVSPAIVSYVLNNSNYVSQEKRDAVLKAVKELDYHLNSVAQSLRQKKTHNFVVLTRDIRNEMFCSIIYYLESTAYAQGYFISITSTDSQEKADAYFDTLMSRKYDGIILATNIYSEAQLNRLANLNIPTVLFQYKHFDNLHPSISVFKPLIFEAAKKSVDYLIDTRGHKMVGYLTYGNPMKTNEPGPFGVGFCVNGYLQSLREHNIEAPKEWIVHLDAREEAKPNSNAVDDVVRQYINTPENKRPSAFFSGTDTVAARLVATLQRYQVRVPEDVEVIGFGNTTAACMCTPALTTINLDCKKSAEAMLQMLIDKCNGEQVASQTLPLTFIKRDSA